MSRSQTVMAPKKGKKDIKKGQQARNAAGRASVLSDILPLPERKFQGRIGTYYTDSEAEVPSMPSAPEGAPNVRIGIRNHTTGAAGVHSPGRAGESAYGAAVRRTSKAKVFWESEVGELSSSVWLSL
jgi:hypothetical protein